MVKRIPRRRRRFNLRQVRINSSLSIGALASADVIAGAITNAPTDPLRFISVELAYGITELQNLADDTFAFGLAHGDYSAAEIEECLESGASMDLGDKIAQERSNRLVRQIGQISSTAGSTTGEGLPFNAGVPVKTKLNWLMSIGDTLQIWVRNNSGTVYTTGASLSVAGKLWVKDIQ